MEVWIGDYVHGGSRREHLRGRGVYGNRVGGCLEDEP